MNILKYKELLSILAESLMIDKDISLNNSIIVNKNTNNTYFIEDVFFHVEENINDYIAYELYAILEDYLLSLNFSELSYNDIIIILINYDKDSNPIRLKYKTLICDYAIY